LFSDSIDILNYEITLDIINLSSKQISGYTDLQITTYVNGLNTVPLELLQLSVDSINVDGISTSSYVYNDTVIQIQLSNSISIGDTLLIRVYYHGQPKQDSYWGGFYFSNDNMYAFNLGVGFDADPHNFGKVWFPCIDDFHDRATYTLNIRTQDTKIAVGGGILISEIHNGNNTKTYTWRLNQSIPTYLASIAVGNYIVISDTFTGINGPIPINIYVKPGDSNNVAGSFIHLKDMLQIYENAFGSYRWERVGYVGVPFAGGAMEHVTNIALGNGYIDGTLNYETLIAHELSHMWFGDLVTCASAEDMWLNEGWAVYCEAFMKEGVYGKQAYKDFVRDNHKYVVQFAHIIDNGYLALYGIPHDYTYGTTVYDKGGDVVHTLRGYLGDSLFFKSVKAYLDQYEYDYASTSDLRDFLSAYTGVNMNDFFDGWIYTPGFPQFSIDSFNVYQPPVPEKTVTVYIKQKLRGRNTYTNSNILDVTFMDENWNIFSDTIVFSGQTGQKVFQLPFAPVTVMLDIEEKISDATVDNYQTINGLGVKEFPNTYFTMEVEQITDSAFVRITHNYVSPDPLKNSSNSIFRISNNRYWTVEGIFPTGFNSKGKFEYNRTNSTSNGYLDNVFLPSVYSVDSLVLLYRMNASDDWKIVNFVRDGNFVIGNLTTLNLRPGEYTLGIGLPNQSGVVQNKENEISFNLFPNPSNNKVKINIESKNASYLKIIESDGKLIDTIYINQGENSYQWDPQSKADGTYYFQLYNSKDQLVIVKKFIYIKK
ncbi:M1 family aminopeptidase, partial [Bacteroidota bacterium]